MNNFFQLRKLGWNFLWYLPLALWVIMTFLIPNAVSGFQNFGILLRQFHWGYLISPSAYVFTTATLTSIILPSQLIFFFIPAIFVDKEAAVYKRRYLYTTLAVLAIIISAFLIQFIIWGSFPSEIDSQGYIRLRMIPFIPWPDRPTW